jgi:geranylgeranyl pyrophosphate synthase
LLDADPRGEHQTLGAPAAANLAAAFQAAALEVISQEGKGCNPTVKLACWHSLNQMMLTTAFGQYLDVQNPADEAAYWRVVETKSAPFYGAALQIGALAGGASLDIAERLQQLGCLYGEIIQLHDDLNDAMAAPANPDWTLGRSSLPMLFAQSVEHSEQGRFLELRRVLQSMPDPEALAEAQRILIRCGAISYSIYELTRRHQAAQEILNGLKVSQRTGLELLFEDALEPVKKLFATIEVA